MATSHVEMFHQIKSELFKDHEAAVGRRVDRNEWEKAMEDYFSLLDAQRRTWTEPVKQTETTTYVVGTGLWDNY